MFDANALRRSTLTGPDALVPRCLRTVRRRRAKCVTGIEVLGNRVYREAEGGEPGSGNATNRDAVRLLGEGVYECEKSS